MKLLYSTLTFVCLSIAGLSQSYTPFLAEGKIWIVDYNYEPNGWSCDVPQIGGECMTEYYTISGDTLIDNILYQIMWVKSRNNSSLAINNNYGSLIKHAFLREDTITQQVFMNRLSEPFGDYCGEHPTFAAYQEVLLYDFSLQLNDTLPRCDGSYIIKSKSNNDVLNGDSLIRFNDDYQESIGGFQGPTRYFFIVERENVYLQCVYLNGEAIYGSCSGALLNVTHQQNKVSELTIFPSQVKDNLTIISAVNQTINIYNLLGNLVYSELITKGETTLDLSALTPQIYLIKGSSDDKSIGEKIVKL